MPSIVIATAYLYAINFILYGEDVTEKWETAIQNSNALEKAYMRGYYDAKIRELNERKKELENQLNMSVQNNIENDMAMCCCTARKWGGGGWRMKMIEVSLDLINAICKITFITYAWITMLRINEYIKEQESEGKEW